MELMSRIYDAFVFIRKGGVYHQSDLYRRGSQLFAKHGSGYIRLSGSGATSVPKTVWIEIDTGDDPNILITPLGPPTYVVKTYPEAPAEPKKAVSGANTKARTSNRRGRAKT